MTPKEIVQRAIRRERPPRLPVLMRSLGVSDTIRIPVKPSAGFSPGTKGEDEWGCIWEHTDVPNMGQVVVHPLEDIGNLQNLRGPDFSDDSRYVEVVNLQQPRALGIEDIAEKYAGRIAFESLADIQTTLPSGNKDAIEADAEALMTYWASADGGFIFSDYGDGGAIGIPDESLKPFMYDTFSTWSEKIYGSPLPSRPMEPGRNMSA